MKVKSRALQFRNDSWCFTPDEDPILLNIMSKVRILAVYEQDPMNDEIIARSLN